jgi:Rha family phage regulatory protein
MGIMDELVYLKNNEAVCSSLQVADKFSKRHDRVLRAIDNLLETLPKNEETSKMFVLSKRKADDGQYHRMFLMNRDGFSLLVMGFTGKKALDWKLKYIKAFNQMENIIKEKESKEWINSRREGKLTRNAETDTIKKLVEYAKNQGSQHSEMLYMIYSKLANKMAGVSNRDKATTRQLNNLSLMEHIILCEIDSGLTSGKHYKEIYQDCKTRLETVKDLAYLERIA